MDMAQNTGRVVWALPGAALFALSLAAAATGADPGAPAPDGAVLFQQRCAACHQNPDQATSRAPSKSVLAAREPDAIYAALTDGPMKPMAAGLAPADLDAIARYLTGRAPSHDAPVAARSGDARRAAACKSNDAPTAAGPNWNGWSPALDNARFAAASEITAANVGQLKVKWAFAFIGGLGSQPTVVGGRVYLGTGAGQVYSLDAATGCIHWRADGLGSVRAAVSVGPLDASGRLAAFVGDRAGGMHALDAGTGKELWANKVAPTPFATITGSPVLYDGRVYVPISSREEISTYVKGYQCCHFRGQIVALDAATGKEIWRTYMIPDEPRPFREAPDGMPVYGPAGAAIWSAPTIDPKRHWLYVATGDSYTDAPTMASDAVMALDLASGRIAWSRQITADDNYLVGCTGKDGQPSSCPLRLGPDADFGASPVLRELPGGRSVLMVGQKSGEVTALDPDDRGAPLWHNGLSRGGPLGGIEWGLAADADLVFAPIADPFLPKEQGSQGLHAVRIADGTLAWFAPAPQPDCAVAPRSSMVNTCSNGFSAAPTAIPGVVFAGSLDGILRAYATDTGKVLWSENLGQTTYRPRNAPRPMKGDTMNAGGPAVAGGALYVVSGYQTSNAKARNLLLAFTAGGR